MKFLWELLQLIGIFLLFCIVVWFVDWRKYEEERDGWNG